MSTPHWQTGRCHNLDSASVGAVVAAVVAEAVLGQVRGEGD